MWHLVIDRDDFVEFFQQFDRISAVDNESNRRALLEYRDEFFIYNVNVFVKAYLVSACSVLEALIKELVAKYLKFMTKRVADSNLPRNLIILNFAADSKKETYRFETFLLEIDGEKLGETISANIDKTLSAFRTLGVDLASDPSFQQFKDQIGATISKRNRIIHHNDSASDLSLVDVANSIENFKTYTEALIRIVSSSSHAVPVAQNHPGRV